MPMTTSVKMAAQPVVQIITAYQDYASKTYGNGDGVTLCDTRSYSLTQTVIGSSSAMSAWLTLLTAATSANNQVSVNSQSNNDIAYANTPSKCN